MPLEDKLKQLRRERDARTRAPSVESTWEKLGDDAGLTVKQRLERLIALTDKGRGMAVRAEERPVERKRREPVQVFENSYVLGASYGQIPIAMGLQIPADIIGFLSRDAAFEGLDLSSALFLDLETTGLAGGTGTVPFLVGLAYYRDERFKVTQFFLNEMAEEDRLVRELDQFIRDMGFKSLVTYNGKAFDLPLVETRFALQRTPCPLRGLPHLDFLFSARSLWKHKYDSCRLFHLAQQIVQAERSEDIPGAEIPLRYFQYIRSGDFSLIEPILYHNQEDLLSLLGVVVAGAVLVERNREAAAQGRRRPHGPLRGGSALRAGRRLRDVGGPSREGPVRRPRADRRSVDGRPQEALPSFQEEQGLGQGPAVLAGDGGRRGDRLLPRAGHVLRTHGQGPRRSHPGRHRGPGPVEREVPGGREGFREADRAAQGQGGQGEVSGGTMKAMVLAGFGAPADRPLELRDIPVPDVGPEDILIKVRCCGVCHTDLHVVEHELAEARLPLVPGHEVIGTVERMGEKAGRFDVGQRVGAAWLRSTCGVCRFCRSGRENLCEAALFNGYHADGGYAEYMAVDEKFAYAIADGFGDAEAAPLLCAGIVGYRALALSEVQAGGILGLYGFGGSAHIAIQIARHRGIRVFVFTRSAGAPAACPRARSRMGRDGQRRAAGEADKRYHLRPGRQPLPRRPPGDGQGRDGRFGRHPHVGHPGDGLRPLPLPRTQDAQRRQRHPPGRRRAARGRGRDPRPDDRPDVPSRSRERRSGRAQGRPDRRRRRPR